MRINFTLPILVMSMLVVCVSCSKDSQEMVLTPTSNGTKVINASLVSGGAYELPLSTTEIQIHKQALHYSLSAIGDFGKEGMIMYKYIPAEGFTGDDQVTLSDTKTYTRESDRGCNNDMYTPSQTTTTTTFITIKFKVTK